VLTTRQKRLLKRWQLSEKIAALGMTDTHGNPVTLGKDFLGKIEAGTRKPGLDSFRALCAALECEPEELLPGGRMFTLPRALRERKARLDHNRDLRDFAIPRGLRYKNPKTGRVYYGRFLREAYVAHLDLLAAQESGDSAAVAAAQHAYDEKLARVPRALGNQDDRDVPELLAS
jgi:transcriptional regulator with XRE-family HTH domain